MAEEGVVEARAGLRCVEIQVEVEIQVVRHCDVCKQYLADFVYGLEKSEDDSLDLTFTKCLIVVITYTQIVTCTVHTYCMYRVFSIFTHYMHISRTSYHSLVHSFILVTNRLVQ